MLNEINRMIPGLLLKPEHRIFRHVLIQAVILLITMNVFWDEPVRILPGRFAVWIPYHLLFNTIIYVNMYLLVPRLLLKGRTWFYLVSSIVLVLGIMSGIGAIGSLIGENDSRVSSTPVPVLISLASSFVSLYLLITGLTALQLLKCRTENERKINELENVTMKIELSNLQNQINPHFLFNMLNNANILVSENAAESSFILSKLKTLLRYQVGEGSKETVKIKDDLAFIADYLELEKIRRDRFTYIIRSEGNTGLDIPPLLFIPFVENAVKHNPENDSYVKIMFRITGNRLYFECENPKARLPHTRKEGGIGLANIRKRLDLLFGKNYMLTLEDDKEVYTVKMELKI
ncbi:MAG: histidine kinase [Tannerellaceae bacterium]|jgi:sensor histidine kinase YesM|nr:histidine kinase [Tannerellaceae bacterium]